MSAIKDSDEIVCLANQVEAVLRGASNADACLILGVVIGRLLVQAETKGAPCAASVAASIIDRTADRIRDRLLAEYRAGRRATH